MCVDAACPGFTVPFNLDNAEVSRPGADGLGVKWNLHVLSSQIVNIHQVIIFDRETHIFFFGLKCQEVIWMKFAWMNINFYFPFFTRQFAVETLDCIQVTSHLNFYPSFSVGVDSGSTPQVPCCHRGACCSLNCSDTIHLDKQASNYGPGKSDGCQECANTVRLTQGYYAAQRYWLLHLFKWNSATNIISQCY